MRQQKFQFIMDKDTLANIITSKTNTDMERKGILPITSINITVNIIKILLQKMKAKMFSALTHIIEKIGKNYIEKLEKPKILHRKIKNYFI